MMLDKGMCKQPDLSEKTLTIFKHGLTCLFGKIGQI